MFCIPGIVALLTFIIVRPQEIFPVLEKVPFLYLFCALVLFGLAVDLKLRVIKPVPTPQLLWALVFLVLCIVSIAVKSEPALLKERMIVVGVSFLLFFSIAHGVQSFKTLQVITGTIALLCLCLTVVAVHQGVSPHQCVLIDDADPEAGTPDGRSCEQRQQCYGADAEPGGEYRCERTGMLGTTTIEDRVRWRGILRDPNELAMALACGLALVFGFASRRRSVSRTVMTVAFTVLVLIALVMTKSRGGQLVFLGVLGVYFVKRFGAKGLFLGAVMAMPLMLLGGRGGQSADQSAMERLEAWREGLVMLRQHPFFGVGQNMFGEVHVRTAHNSYVLVFGELGLPGFLLWSALLYMSVKILYSGIQRYAGRPGAEVARVWGLALLAAMCGMMIGILFLSFSYHNVLWIYFGLCGAYYSAVKSHDPDWRVGFGLKDAALIVAMDIGFILLLMVYLRYKHV